MSKRVLNRRYLDCFRDYLRREEKSPATVEKYLRDARRFFAFARSFSRLDGETGGGESGSRDFDFTG